MVFVGGRHEQVPAGGEEARQRGAAGGCRLPPPTSSSLRGCSCFWTGPAGEGPCPPAPARVGVTGWGGCHGECVCVWLCGGWGPWLRGDAAPALDGRGGAAQPGGPACCRLGLACMPRARPARAQHSCARPPRTPLPSPHSHARTQTQAHEHTTPTSRRSAPVTTRASPRRASSR
jgi:hypothetical protein